MVSLKRVRMKSPLPESAKSPKRRKKKTPKKSTKKKPKKKKKKIPKTPPYVPDRPKSIFPDDRDPLQRSNEHSPGDQIPGYRKFLLSSEPLDTGDDSGFDFLGTRASPNKLNKQFSTLLSDCMEEVLEEMIKKLVSKEYNKKSKFRLMLSCVAWKNSHRRREHKRTDVECDDWQI